MKKMKFITSMTSLGVLAGAVPIVATSCSNGGNYFVADGHKYNIGHAFTSGDMQGLVSEQVPTYKTVIVDGTPSQVVDHVDYYVYINGKKIDAKTLTELRITSADSSIRYTMPGFLAGATNLKTLDLSGLNLDVILPGFLQPLDLSGIANTIVDVAAPLGSLFLELTELQNKAGNKSDGPEYEYCLPFLVTDEMKDSTNGIKIWTTRDTESPSVIRQTYWSYGLTQHKYQNNYIYYGITEQLKNIYETLKEKLGKTYGSVTITVEILRTILEDYNKYKAEADALKAREKEIYAEMATYAAAPLLESLFSKLRNVRYAITDLKLPHLNQIGQDSVTMYVANFINSLSKYVLQLMPGESVGTVGPYITKALAALIPLLTTQIPVFFLTGLTSVERIDFSPLANAREIPFGFCAGLVSLESADLSSLKQITNIYPGFMPYCTMLSNLKLPTLVSYTDAEGNTVAPSIQSFNSYITSIYQALDLTPGMSISINDSEYKGTEATIHSGDEIVFKLSNVSPYELAKPIITVDGKTEEEGFPTGWSTTESGAGVYITINNNKDEVKFKINDATKVATTGNVVTVTAMDEFDNPIEKGTATLTIKGATAQALTSANSSVLGKMDPTTLAMVNALDSIFGFLTGCPHLRSLDFSPLKELEEIPNNFMGFGRLDLAEMLEMDFEGTDFYPEGITLDPMMLQRIDLSPLTKLHRIGDNFLSTCWNTQEVILPELVQGKDKSGNPVAPTIGVNFLANMASLKKVDLSKIKLVETLPYGFMAFTEGLTDLDLSSLDNVTIIGQKFLAGSGISSVDLSGMQNMNTRASAKIGQDFLAKCFNLKTVRMGDIKASQIVPGASNPEETCFVMYCEKEQTLPTLLGADEEEYKYTSPEIYVNADDKANYEAKFTKISNVEQENTGNFAVRYLTFK